MTYVHDIDLTDITSLPVLILYWIPLAVCAIEYSVLTVRQYRADLAARTHGEHVTPGTGNWHPYVPSVTVGDVILRTLLATCPVLNLVTAILRTGPVLIGSGAGAIRRIWTTPLVPKTKEGKKPLNVSP